MSWMPSTPPPLPMVSVVNLHSEGDDEDHPSKYCSCKFKVRKKQHLFPTIMYKRKLIQSINTGSNKNIIRKILNITFSRSLFWFCVVCLYALFRRHFHMNLISPKQSIRNLSFPHYIFRDVLGFLLAIKLVQVGLMVWSSQLKLVLFLLVMFYE